MMTAITGRSQGNGRVMTYSFGVGDMLPREDLTARFLLDDRGKPKCLLLALEEADPTVEGLLDGFSATASLALKYGLRLDELINTLQCVNPFPPNGPSDQGPVRSMFDYLGHLIDREFGQFKGVGPEMAVVPETNPRNVHQFSIGGFAGRFTRKYFSDGRVAGISFSIAVPHERYQGLATGICHGIGDVVSFCLKSGLPPAEIVGLWEGRRFRPAGKVEGPGAPYTKSVLDYAAQFLRQID